MYAPWYRALSAGLVCLTLLSSAVADGKQSAVPTKKALSAQELAARIDFHIQARWAALKVVPASQADDAEFIRRVCLDVIGRIPAVSEMHPFLSDKSPDKRRQLVTKLLGEPGKPSNA